MLVANGNDKKSLLDYLSSVKNTLSIDSVLTTASKLTLDCVYDSGRLRWNLKKLPDGRKLSLRSILKNDAAENLTASTDAIAILSYRKCEAAKTWDGKVISSWLVVEPYNSVPIDSDGAIRYEQQTILLDDIEDVQSGIAISINHSIYMVDQSALASLARYMQSSTGCGDRIDDDTLGVCIQLAQAFEKDVKVKFLVSKKDNLPYCNLIGIVGRNYNLFDMKRFYKTLFNYMSKRGIWTVKAFKATTINTESMLEWAGMEEFSIGIAVATPEIKNSYSVCPYIRYNNVFFYIDENKISHKKDYESQMETLEQRLDMALCEIGDIAQTLSLAYDDSYEEVIRESIHIKSFPINPNAEPVTNSTLFAFLESVIDTRFDETSGFAYLTIKRLEAGQTAKMLHTTVRKSA